MFLPYYGLKSSTTWLIDLLLFVIYYSISSEVFSSCTSDLVLITTRTIQKIPLHIHIRSLP